MNTQNFLAFYSNLILQGDFAISREFHLHMTFITELQKYLAVYSYPTNFTGRFCYISGISLAITVEVFKGLSELTRLAELTCKLRLHVPGWLKNAYIKNAQHSKNRCKIFINI